MGSWNMLRRMDAKKKVDAWNEHLASDTFGNFLDGYSPALSDKYSDIRENIVEIFNAVSRLYKTSTYRFDSEFGLRLYVYFKDLGITESDASNDDFWRYIQMVVVPDVVCKRWPPANGKINDKRLWSDASRLYLNVLWWYIHYIWADNEEDTRKYMVQVDISQITDRSGKNGTRIEIYREILHIYASVDRSLRIKGLIGKVMMLNSSYCVSFEPGLSGTSVRDYVKRVYGELGIDVRYIGERDCRQSHQ